MSGFVQEFKTFAMRGSVIDMAVGFIIGGAFGKITDSLVTDVLLPPMNLLTGNVDFTQLYVTLGGNGAAYESADAAREAGAAVIAYGSFLNALLQFLLLALAVFLMVRAVNRMRARPEEAGESPTTKPCPYCLTVVDIQATRCPSCTSALEASAEAAPAG